MSAFYAATALGSPVTKHLAAHLPAPVVLAVAALVASTTMLVASQATGVATPLAVLAVGGSGADDFVGLMCHNPNSSVLVEGPEIRIGPVRARLLTRPSSRPRRLEGR
jgi:hypothetical protein